eukprot:scaffold8331_cov439-Pinguiococcus_pyrenoidosus.AAC.1
MVPYGVVFKTEVLLTLRAENGGPFAPFPLPSAELASHVLLRTTDLPHSMITLRGRLWAGFFHLLQALGPRKMSRWSGSPPLPLCARTNP